MAAIDIESSRRLGVALSFYGHKPHSQHWVKLGALFAVLILAVVFGKAGIDLLAI
jgi:hypothetical protein